MIGAPASMSVVPVVAGVVLKVTAILAGGALLTVLARRQPAATRHFVWLVALSSALALTVLTPIVPRIAFRIAVRAEFKPSPGNAIDPTRDMSPPREIASADRDIPARGDA